MFESFLSFYGLLYFLSYDVYLPRRNAYHIFSDEVLCSHFVAKKYFKKRIPFTLVAEYKKINFNNK